MTGSAGDSDVEFTLEGLFEALLEEPATIRAAYYRAHGVPQVTAELAEELFHAHASADFVLPEAPNLDELGTSAELSGVGTVLDGRYSLVEVLGGGSFGTVYRGLDQLVGEEVAVKVPCVAPLSRAALEREVACLRRLEHGVARLRDQGVFVDGTGLEFHYLVYDLIEGTPFPGPGCPRKAFFSLMQSVAAVHARGVVHRDLKPANVLVTQDCTAFLVDFGIAHGPAFGAEHAGRDLSVGTEAFAAPEQLEGEMGDAGSDVYSCALMGLTALTGVDALVLRSAAVLPGDDNGRCPAALDPLNAELAAALFAITQLGREERPRNAGELEAKWERLGPKEEATLDPGRSHAEVESMGTTRASLRTLVQAALARPVEEGDLLWAPVFTGIEPIHHLRSGGALELERRSGSAEDSAVRVLRKWIERGVAFWSNDRIELHSAGLQALRSEPLDAQDESELAAEDFATRSAWVQSVAARVRALEVDGWNAQASSVVLNSLARIRSWPIGSAAAERRLLPILVRLAIQDAAPGSLDLAAFEVARSRTHGALRAGLDFALQLARSSAHGQPLSELLGDPNGWDDRLEGGQVDEDEALEWERLSAIVLSYQYRGSLSLDRGVERRVRRAVALRARHYGKDDQRSAIGDESQGNHDSLRAVRFGWLALRAYRSGHFARSAALYRASARATDSVSSLVGSLLAAASAAMETGDFVAALGDVESARAKIQGLPFPQHEARASWTLRTLRFRMGELPEPNLELDAGFVALASLRLSALHCLTEAAIARAAGNTSRMRAMAEASWAAFEPLGQPESTALARALVIDSGGAAKPGDAALFGSLTAASDPGVALQVVALAPDARDVCEPLLRGWVDAFQSGPPGCRFDVLNVVEIETGLGFALPAGPVASMD